MRSLIELRNKLVTRAADLASHKGYQTWHRAYDNEVVDWILGNANATQAEFLQWLRGLYARPDMARRFPGGLP